VIKTITNTTFTIGVISVLNFVLITLVSNFLFKEGVTEMGLIVLGISFIVMINNLVGGSSLVYLASRESLFSLLVVSYSWAIVSSILMGGVLFIFDLVPREYVLWVILIGFLECVFSIHNQIYIGKEDMKTHNSLKLSHKIIQVLLFVIIGISIRNFVLSLVISYLILLIFSFYKIFQLNDSYQVKELKQIFKKAFKYGFQIQSSNIIQLINYRILYYFIKKYMGDALGIFIVAVQLAESLWIPSKALAIIQYGKVANEKKEENKKSLSLKFMKISFFATLVLTIILLLIPDSFILFVFGKSISGTKPIILALSIGVISISVAQSFSHYLSGKGLYFYLFRASVIGLVTLLISSAFLFTDYQLIGAGLATSLSYLASTLYLGKSFLKESNSKLKDFMIKKSEIKSLISTFKVN
jgi:O-antigen/teichoic acid export membrane protein